MGGLLAVRTLFPRVARLVELDKFSRLKCDGEHSLPPSLGFSDARLNQGQRVAISERRAEIPTKPSGVSQSGSHPR